MRDAIRRSICRAFAVLAAISAADQALASPACDTVNAGDWDITLTLFGTGYTSMLYFDAGDTLHITGTHIAGPGGFQLNGNNASVASSPAPGTINYTVPSSNLSLTVGLGSGSTPSTQISITATCDAAAPGSGSGSGADASQALTKSFLASRINGILLNDPTNASLLRRATDASTPMTTAMAGSATSVASNSAALRPAMGLGLGDDSVDTAGAHAIQFSQSLSGLRRQMAQSRMEKDRMALGAGDGGAAPLAHEASSPWDVWVEGRYSAFDNDNGNLDRDGHVGLLYVGADYRVAENMIVGVLAQFDWSKEKSDTLSSEVDGDGWMVGPYLSARIHDNIYFDLRAAWGGSSNDLALNGATGDFDTSRWLVKGTLSGNWVYEAWRFTPSAELAYMEESQDAFTNSAGTDVRGQDVSLGRLQFGPEIGYRIVQSEDAIIEPFVAIKGVWDFDNPNAVIAGHVTGPGDVWGRLQGGLNVATTSGWSVRGLASWDGLGASDYTGYTLQGSMNVPLN